MAALKNIVAAALLATGALSAQAQVTSTINYNLVLSDAPWTGRFYSDQPCEMDTHSPVNRYRTMTVQVTVAGNYQFFDESYDAGGSDSTLGIYSGAFDPANPATRCVASVDDDQTVNLSPGTYTLVLSSYDGIGEEGEGGEPEDAGIPGAFRYSVTGPARVGPPASVASVPTLAEWSLALLALSAAGLGMRGLRRKD
ncbi:MAG: IPTL-CTERM sorting domain-containing protein [Ottowia sp.]|uniref:IPTL-CTERM sorting domain-containing protein n=1 Tax=Ottowia sp. TaxID=1898956 RepID=UPI003C73D605